MTHGVLIPGFRKKRGLSPFSQPIPKGRKRGKKAKKKPSFSKNRKGKEEEVCHWNSTCDPLCIHRGGKKGKECFALVFRNER